MKTATFLWWIVQRRWSNTRDTRYGNKVKTVDSDIQIWKGGRCRFIVWYQVWRPIIRLSSDLLFYLLVTAGGGPRVVVSTAAFHARVRGSVNGLGGLKETKMFLLHSRVKVSIVGSLRDREVACSASDRQGSNFESCVWRTVSSQSSYHPQEVLLAQFSLYVHKGGLKPDSFHFISWSLRLLIRVPFQFNGELTVRQPFRRIELIIHLAISILPGTHFHLSQVKHLRVKCLAQDKTSKQCPRIERRETWYFSRNPTPSGIRSRTAGSSIV